MLQLSRKILNEKVLNNGNEYLAKDGSVCVVGLVFFAAGNTKVWGDRTLIGSWRCKLEDPVLSGILQKHELHTPYYSKGESVSLSIIKEQLIAELSAAGYVKEDT